MRKYYLTRMIYGMIILMIPFQILFGQENEMLVNPQSFYTEGIRAFENGSFSESILDFDTYLIDESHYNSWPDLLKVNSKIYEIKSAYENDQSFADEMLKNIAFTRWLPDIQECSNSEVQKHPVSRISQYWQWFSL